MLKCFRDILLISLLMILANITFTESLFSQEHRQEAAREMTVQGIINTVMRDVEETAFFNGSIERVLQVRNLGKENSTTTYCIKPSLFYECKGEELSKNDQWSNKYYAPPRGFLYILDKSKLKYSMFKEKTTSLDIFGIKILENKVSGKFISGKGTTSYTDFENLLFIGYDNKTTSFDEWSGDANCVRLQLKPEGSTCFSCPLGKQKNGPFEAECTGREIQFEESKRFLWQFKPKIICAGQGDETVGSLMKGIGLVATADMIVGETPETLKSPGVADVVAMRPDLLGYILVVLDISALEESFGTFGWIEGNTYGKEALYFNKGYLEIRVSDKNQYNVSLRDNRFVYPYLLLKGTEIEFQLGSTKISIKPNEE